MRKLAAIAVCIFWYLWDGIKRIWRKAKKRLDKNPS